MATIKIPYTYKVYNNSKLGTWVDRFCHTPSRIAWMVLGSFLLLGYFTVCFSVLPVSGDVKDFMSGLAAVVVLVSFVGSFFLGILCDKCRISERVAIWDIMGRKVSRKMKIVLIVLIVALLLPGICAAGVSVANAAQANAYQKTMAVLENPEAVPVEGNKAVTCAQGGYFRDYIPEDLQADTPEEVRYMINCTDGEELYGTYGISGILGYRRWRRVEVVDRETGEVLDSETFYGSNPPHSVSEDSAKKQYGSKPSDTEISWWVSQVLPRV